MSKMGTTSDTPNGYKKFTSTVKNSYIYRFFRKLFSIICTLLLISLLIIGGMMFIFNMKSNAAKSKGQTYTPPFGLYTIISGSMEPNVQVYDVVVTVDVQDMNSIKVGDIITFISSWDLNYGTTVTHRVVAISKTETGEVRLTTKGDANQSVDGAVVTRDNLIGKVQFRIPQLGRVQFFLATKMGWFIAIFIPAVAIIIMDVMKILKLRVVKKDIGNIKDIKEAEKTYFEDEYLDRMEIEESKLDKTIAYPKLKEDLDELENTIPITLYKRQKYTKKKEKEEISEPKTRTRKKKDTEK